MSTPDIATLVAESRARQGLPAKVSNPSAMRRLAALLLATNGEGAPKGARTTCSPLTAATPPQRGGGLRAG